MMTPAEGLARCPSVGPTLSESFAVIAHRKHTLAVRNYAKFRGVFPIFGCQTLFSRQTFGSIRQTFLTKHMWYHTRDGGIGLRGPSGPFPVVLAPSGSLHHTTRSVDGAGCCCSGDRRDEEKPALLLIHRH